VIPLNSYARCHATDNFGKNQTELRVLSSSQTGGPCSSDNFCCSHLVRADWPSRNMMLQDESRTAHPVLFLGCDWMPCHRRALSTATRSAGRRTFTCWPCEPQNSPTQAVLGAALGNRPPRRYLSVASSTSGRRVPVSTP